MHGIRLIRELYRRPKAGPPTFAAASRRIAEAYYSGVTMPPYGGEPVDPEALADRIERTMADASYARLSFSEKMWRDVERMELDRVLGGD